MTMDLAFDLFTIEDDLIVENELVKSIDSEFHKRKSLTTNLFVITNENHQIENSEIKINNHKAENEKRQNENSEIKSLFNKAYTAETKNFLFGNQNVKSIKVNTENENFENEMLDSEKVRKDMVRGYLKLMN